MRCVEDLGLLHELVTAVPFYTIGIARETNKYFTAKNNLHNIPKTITEGWEYCTPAPTRTEQYFFDS